MNTGPYKLVITEDVARTRRGLTSYFDQQDSGFRVVASFDNGHDALNYVLHNPVDVLLCDIRLPLLSGVEIARNLHASGSRTRIVFISAYREFEYAVRALEYGVETYLTKPIKQRELFDAFDRIRGILDEERLGGIDAEPLDSKSHAQQVIELAKRFVEAVSDDVTLAEVAGRVYMSPSHFSRYFRDHTGMTFAEFRRSVRMKRAAALLRLVDKNIGDVSQEVGYDNPKNFTRAFRKYFGMTPRQYRDFER
jgi:YesN/AraC family two-component response regulator